MTEDEIKTLVTEIEQKNLVCKHAALKVLEKRMDADVLTPQDFERMHLAIRFLDVIQQNKPLEHVMQNQTGSVTT